MHNIKGWDLDSITKRFIKRNEKVMEMCLFLWAKMKCIERDPMFLWYDKEKHWTEIIIDEIINWNKEWNVSIVCILQHENKNKL